MTTPDSVTTPDGLELVARATELARAIAPARLSGDARRALPELLRAVVLFLRALMPAARREALDAIAELTVLEILRSHLERPGGEVQDDAPAEALRAGPRILDIPFRATALEFSSPKEKEPVQHSSSNAKGTKRS